MKRKSILSSIVFLFLIVLLTLKDGSLFVTYDAGSVIEESPEGGSAGYQAFFLEGENKTVELRADYSGTA